MNLKKGKFKIVEGTRVRMVSSKDTHIVEGAYGTVSQSWYKRVGSALG